MVKVTTNIGNQKFHIHLKKIKLNLYKKKSTDTDFFNNIRYILKLYMLTPI